MLHKILHNVDHPNHCKLPQFAMPNRITQHTVKQNDKALSLLNITPINSLDVLPVLLLVSGIVYQMRWF